jgi:hypothetical protein
MPVSDLLLEVPEAELTLLYAAWRDAGSFLVVALQETTNQSERFIVEQ